MSTTTTHVYDPNFLRSGHSAAKGAPGTVGFDVITHTETESGGGYDINNAISTATGVVAAGFGGGVLTDVGLGGTSAVTDHGGDISSYLHGVNTSVTTGELSNSDKNAGLRVGAVALTGAGIASAAAGGAAVDAGADTVQVGSDVVDAGSDTVQVGSDTVVVQGGADTQAATINTDLAGQGYGVDIGGQGAVDVTDSAPLVNTQVASADITGAGVPTAAAAPSAYAGIGPAVATGAATGTIAGLLQHWFPGAKPTATSGPYAVPGQTPAGTSKPGNISIGSPSSAPGAQASPWFTSQGGKTTLTQTGMYVAVFAVVGFLVARKLKYI